MAKKMKIETNKKKEKWNIFSDSSEGFSKSVLTGSRIEIFSNSQLILEGCAGILEYSDNYLKLRLSHGAVVLEGENFDIVSYEEKTIVVKGKFSSLEFCV